MSNWRDEVEESIYVNFSTTGFFEGLFIGGSHVETKFGKCLQLKFMDKSGNEKLINTKSRRLSGKMKDIPDNTQVKIIRSGEGFETHYEVEVRS